MQQTTTFIIDFSKYPNVQDKMDNYIQPWDAEDNLIDWDSYGTGWEGKAENGILKIVDTPEGFSEKMGALLKTLNREVPAFVGSISDDEDGEEELLLDEDEDKVELLSLENDVLQMTYFSRRGRRVLSNKNI